MNTKKKKLKNGVFSSSILLQEASQHDSRQTGLGIMNTKFKKVRNDKQKR